MLVQRTGSDEARARNEEEANGYGPPRRPQRGYHGKRDLEAEGRVLSDARRRGTIEGRNPPHRRARSVSTADVCWSVWPGCCKTLEQVSGVVIGQLMERRW